MRSFLLAWVFALLATVAHAADRRQAEEWVARGRELWKTDKPGAIAAYTRAIEADPTHHAARYDRTLLYMETDQARAAMADLASLEKAGFEGAQRIRGLMMTVADAHTSIAGAMIEKGEYQAALDKLAVVLTYQPEHADAHVVRGVVKVQQGRLDEAMADYDRGIVLDPRSPEAFHNRGLLHARRAAYRKAVADFTRAIELEPGEPSNYAERGAAHAALGDSASARSDLQTSARLQSEALQRRSAPKE